MSLLYKHEPIPRQGKIPKPTYRRCGDVDSYCYFYYTMIYDIDLPPIFPYWDSIGRCQSVTSIVLTYYGHHGRANVFFDSIPISTGYFIFIKTVLEGQVLGHTQILESVWR